MIGKDSSVYDFVIVGTGPAGMTAAITAKRLGHFVVVLEKGEIAGPKPRGEGMGYFPILDEILGEGYLPSIGFRSHGGRVWHSPGDTQTTTTFRDYPHYFFKWRHFMDRFVEVANELNIEILLNSEVVDPIEENNRTIGVNYKDKDETIQEIRGTVIMDCSGYAGIIGRNYGIPYDKMNCPIVKCLISNANFSIKKTPELQFYFIGNGDLEYAPFFPPSVAYFFPLERNGAEVGLILRMSQVPNMKMVEIPSESQIMEVWSKVKSSYPGYNKYFKGATIDYEELTYLTNAKMAETFVPNNGVVLLGDSAGFVNPFGSSGLYYSMEMANFWVKMISKVMKSGRKDELWNKETLDAFEAEFRETEVYKAVSGYYNLIGAFEYKIFNRLRTAEKINKKWDYIAGLLEKA